MDRRNPQRARRACYRVGGPEAPLLIPGLKAWFDLRTDAYITISTGISAWVSRAGSLGSIAWTQGTAGNQPARATAVATLGSKNAAQFDGTDDGFDINNANAMKFMNDGTGASRFTVLRIDSTGGALQYFEQNASSNAQVGLGALFNTTNVTLAVYNASGSSLNVWSNNTAAHYARDTSRWWMWGYVDGTQHSRVSGSSLTNSDTGGQDPNTGNPTRALRMGASTALDSLPLKGVVAQDLYYDHILTAGETAQLANYFAPIYGVAA